MLCCAVLGAATPFPRLAAWYEALRAQPAFEAVHADIWRYWEQMEGACLFEPILCYDGLCYAMLCYARRRPVRADPAGACVPGGCRSQVLLRQDAAGAA